MSMWENFYIQTVTSLIIKAILIKRNNAVCVGQLLQAPSLLFQIPPAACQATALWSCPLQVQPKEGLPISGSPLSKRAFKASSSRFSLMVSVFPLPLGPPGTASFRLKPGL